MPQALTCEKCRGEMAATKARRFSPGLALIGYTLWVPALLVMLGTGGCSLLALKSASDSLGDALETAKVDIRERLQQIEGLPPEVTAQLESGHLHEVLGMLDKLDLPPEMRKEVRAAIAEGGRPVTGATWEGAATAGLGGCALVALYALLVPLFVVGLVLTTKRRVWQCASCGFIFDRA
jgi:hypothetical protein